MATTYELIAKNVLGSDTATITISNIPATYDDLLILASVRSTRSGDDNYALTVTNATAYSLRNLIGTGSSALSQSLTGNIRLPVGDATWTSDTFSNFEYYIPNYTSTSSKSVSVTGVAENNSTVAYCVAVAGLVTMTSAITEVSFASTNSVNTAAGSSFYLYGITKA
jgi:hypothetical protein